MNVINKEQVYSTPYLSLYQTEYEHKGSNRRYFHVSRNKDNIDKVDAVIVAGITPDEKLVLTSEYRIPIQRREIGLPAGLINEGETPEEAAVREFKEETGMDFTVDMVSPPLFSSAGMTDESVVMVFGEATGEPNKSWQEDAEDIEIMILDKKEVADLMGKPDWSKTAWPIAMMFLLEDVE